MAFQQVGVLDRPWNAGIGDWRQNSPTAVGGFAPSMLSGGEAWYDVADASSMLNNAGAVPSSGDGIKLLSDKSGNSGVNAFIAGVGTGNIAYLTTGTAVGTGDFTVVQRFIVPPTAPSGGTPAVSFASAITGPSAANGLIFDLTSSYNVLVGLYGAAGSDFRYNTYGALLSSFSGQVVTLTLTRSGGTWTLYLNGAAQTPTATNTTGGGAPAFTATVSSTYMTFGAGLTTAATTIANFPVLAGRAYSTALDATGVLADYNGTVQANNFVNVNFALMAKLATAPVATSGQTVTVTTSGATGARICGARDLYQGTAANQPIYLPHSGTNYGYLNGVAGNYFSTPDSVAVSVTGDIDLRAYVAMDDWTPSSTQRLLARWTAGTNNRAYSLAINSGGSVVLEQSTVGSDGTTFTSTVTTGLANYAAKWVRGTLDVDNGAAGRTATFYLSDDGTNWTQLGATVTTATAVNTFDGSSVLEIGAFNLGTQVLTGNIYRAQIYNGIAGTLAFDFNPAAYTSGTTFLDSSSNAATITINGGATIVNSTRLYFDGSNDYLKAAAFSLSQPETVYFVGQQVSWTANEYFYDGGAAASMILAQKNGAASPDLQIFAGSLGPTNSGLAVGTNGIVTAVFNNASSALRINRTASVTGTAGATAANGLTIGAAGNATLFSNITASEVLVRSVADDTATQDRVNLYLGRKWQIAV